MAEARRYPRRWRSLDPVRPAVCHARSSIRCSPRARTAAVPATSTSIPGLRAWTSAGGSTACSSPWPSCRRSCAPNIVARLKVLAELLTYRTDVPQEGRIRGVPGEVEMRLSTFPTLHGEKAVVRALRRPGAVPPARRPGPARGGRASPCRAVLDETSGAVILSGPAGSGKTTTLYACLRELVGPVARRAQPGDAGRPDRVGRRRASPSRRSTPRPGSPSRSGLRSLLRQDPEVIAIGEIRDRATAEIALQASLTGHLIADHVPRRQRLRGHRPAARHGDRALRHPQRPARRGRPAAGPQALRRVLGSRPSGPKTGSGCRSRRRGSPAAATPAAGPATGAGSSWPSCSCPDQDQLGLAILARADVHRLEQPRSRRRA